MSIDTAIEYNFRWMKKEDFDSILDIENLKQPNPWSEFSLNKIYKRKSVVSSVVTVSDSDVKDLVVGYLFYSQKKHHFQIRRMEVNEGYSFEEVGEILLNNLLKRLNKSKRLLVRFVVRESDLKMQLFLSKQGFFAVKVIKDKFKNKQEDGYVMVKSCLDISEY